MFIMHKSSLFSQDAFQNPDAVGASAISVGSSMYPDAADI